MKWTGFTRGEEMPSLPDTKKKLAAVCRRLDDLRYAPGSSGNVSARIGPHHILITPTGCLLRDVKPTDLIRVSLSGKYDRRGKRSSCELDVHIAIYRKRPDVNAIAHAHPPVTVGFAVAHQDLGEPSNLESYLTVGKPVLVPFAPPGDPGPLLKRISEGNAFILANHGAITLGETIGQALHRMEALENLAQAVLVARHVGKVRPFSGKDLRAIRAFMKRMGIAAPAPKRPRI
jgi:L-fuculose-phosphate aldolase